LENLKHKHLSFWYYHDDYSLKCIIIYDISPLEISGHATECEKLETIENQIIQQYCLIHIFKIYMPGCILYEQSLNIEPINSELEVFKQDHPSQRSTGDRWLTESHKIRLFSPFIKY